MSGREQPTRPNAGRLPPGQHEVNNFPVLDLGVHPEIPLDKWQLKIHGEVENPVTLNWGIHALPQFTDVSDFHCVTTWSQFDMEFEGVAFFTMAELVKPKLNTSHLFFTGYDDYTTNNTLDACMDDDVMIAHSWNGQPLSAGAWRPGLAWLSPSSTHGRVHGFIREIEFRDHDELGFWEQRGYSNTVDPFVEDRFFELGQTIGQAQ